MFKNSFSQEVWASTYKSHQDKSLEDTFRRVAKFIASAEQPRYQELWEDRFFDLLSDFKGVPGGRILSNAGVGLKGTSLMNCFVGPQPEYDLDSMEGIHKVLKDQANTLKSEGGWGYDFSFIRPRGSFIAGVAAETPGAVYFMELFDKSSEIITAGSGKKSSNSKAKGKIRKGAMMATLSVSHPDIVEFITAKQTPGKLTKFNLSVDFSDEFMVLVNSGEDADWNLEFPDTSHPDYKRYWKGSLKAWKKMGLPVKVHDTVKVKWLWDLFLQSNYNRAEPGALFLDRANAYNPLSYGETILSSNPCVVGETLILTRQGYQRIDGLVGSTVDVWNGVEWSSVSPKVTGVDQEILDLRFSEGSHLACTPYHGFFMKDGSKVEAKDLKVGDSLAKFEFPVIQGDLLLDNAYARGVYAGDGSANHNHVWLYGGKTALLDFLPYRSVTNQNLKNGMERLFVILDIENLDKVFVPDSRYSVESRVEWFAGLLDTDGCEADGCIQISSIDRKFLANVKMMLNTLGVSCSLGLMKHTALKMIPDGKGGKKEYESQDCWRINVSAEYSSLLLKLGMKPRRVVVPVQGGSPNRRFVKVASINKRDKTEDKVYCFTEPLRHAGVFGGVLTAQCGEQVLAPGGVCCLGSLNLTQFVNEDLTGFDYEKLSKYVGYMVRFLDNVSSLSLAPLPEYINSMRDKRRIGAGVMGWGSALMMLRVPFGSEQAEQLREKVMSTYATTAYETSIELAIEKGAFPLCENEKHADGLFVRGLNLSEKSMHRLRKYGIRNSSVLSQQPTGNTSILANVVSGGIEPVFMQEYIRTVIVPTPPEDMLGVIPQYSRGEFHETSFFKFAKEGDETILRGVTKDGVVYKIDKNRGLTKEVLCEDYAVAVLKERGLWDANAPWAATTTSLTTQQHVDDLKGFARWTDSACSKTVNVPNDYPYKDFEKLYLEIYNTGYVKGATTYRSGTMTSVLSAKIDVPEEIILEDVKLPTTMNATLVTMKAEGKKWYMTVGFDQQHSKPLAIFIQTNNEAKETCSSNAVDVLLNMAQEKGIPLEHIQTTKKKIVQDNNTSQLCRALSLCFRHGVSVTSVVNALNTVDCTVGTFVFHMRKYLATLIKDGQKVAGEVCSSCQSESIVYQEGCKVCTNCGASVCG